MSEEAVHPQEEAANSTDKTGKLNASLLIVRVKRYTLYTEPPDQTTCLISCIKNTERAKNKADDGQYVAIPI